MTCSSGPMYSYSGAAFDFDGSLVRIDDADVRADERDRLRALALATAGSGDDERGDVRTYNHDLGAT